jgi:membrane protein YqaA with SNARE-associated domain
MTDLAAYAGLFISALGAATLLPGSSEAVLGGLLLAGYSPALLIIVASVGNILGSVINWWLGTQIERFRGRKWFPVSGHQLDRAQGWYGKYGRWSLLLSWAPVIGDPLTMIAGVLREPLPSFLAIVSVAKIVRYLIVAWGVLSVS